MDRFGDKLRSVRELKGLTLEQLALETRIDGHHLLALESGEFGELPDDDAVRGYLRACAERLDVDGEMMIADYLQDRPSVAARASQGIEIVVETVPAAPSITQPPAAPRRRARSPRVWVAIGGVTLLALSAWVAGRRSPPGDPAVALPEPAPAGTSALEVVRPLEVAAPQAAPAVAPSPVPAPPQTPGLARPADAAEATTPSVVEFGVGSGVEHRQLVGATDRFEEGTRAWFWTRVHGGERGDLIEHVWLREGVEMARVPLRIGGAQWRTQSSKQLRPGTAGTWSAEARDAAGRLLARADFTVVP